MVPAFLFLSLCADHRHGWQGRMAWHERHYVAAGTAHRRTVRAEPEVRRLIEELRWFGISVGAANEPRTQSARIHAAVDVLRPRYVRGPVRARITHYFSERIRLAWIAAKDLLASPRFPAMIEDLMAEERLLRSGVVAGIDGIDNSVVLDALLDRVRSRMRAVEAAGEEDREAENSGESTFTYGLLLQREIDRSAHCSSALPSAYWQSLRNARVMAEVHSGSASG
ncbi:hypothetical protein ACIO14_18595 [Nocardia fluminea]|uniref:hypothetical protein n=1 Tax=Nocardia fluminea TaxID=134984 RepID=UPI0037FC54AA